jgi:hypothetical protein
MKTIQDEVLGKISIKARKSIYNDYLKTETFRKTKSGVKVITDYFDRKSKRLIISFENTFQKNAGGKSSYYYWSHSLGYKAIKLVGDPKSGGASTRYFPGKKSYGYTDIEKIFGVTIKENI